MGDHMDDVPPWDDSDIDNASEDAYSGSRAESEAKYAAERESAASSSRSVPKGTLNALYRIEDPSGKHRWLRIGTAFANRNGNGFTLNIDALPLNFNGKILLARPLK
jgi:hypothetical protein